jgi:hypothetical protein
MADTFLVSVANAIGLDPTTDAALFYGKANTESAFTLSMQATDVRGGINNPLRYKFMHDRDLAIKITQAVFGKTILALNVGSSIVNGAVNVLKTECVQLTTNVGAVTETPVGNVTVLKADGTWATVTPSTKAITISGGGNTMVTAFYRYSDTVDQISIGTTTPPDIIKLILMAEVRDTDGDIVEYLQIEVPSFQIDGNYELSLAADGVSTEGLAGNALSVAGTTCTDGDVFGYVRWIPNTAAAIDYSDIFVTPNVFEPDAGVLATQQLTVYGVRGGVYRNVNITALCTFAKAVGGDADITVGASTGLISVADTSTAADTATIVATYVGTSATLTDNCIVTAQTP